MILFFFVFFFKPKTAYEITRRDWSSDVCSSDLGDRGALEGQPGGRPLLLAAGEHGDVLRSEERREGKSVPCCVDLGGRRIIKKKKKRERGGRGCGRKRDVALRDREEK